MKTVMFLAAAAIVSTSADAALAFWPVDQKITQHKRVASLYLRNDAGRTMTYELSPASAVGGGDLIVTPRVVTLAPGETKRARIAHRAPPAAHQDFYRINIDDITAASGVVARLSLSLPVFVGDGAPDLVACPGKIKNVGNGVARVVRAGGRPVRLYIERGAAVDVPIVAGSEIVVDGGGHVVARETCD